MKTEIKTIQKTQLKSSLFQRIIKIDEVGVFVALVVISVGLALTTKNFTNPVNIIQVARETAYFGIMAVGMVFVISQGDIDISVGAIYNLSAIGMAYALAHGLPIGLVIPVGLLIGAILGLFNGAIAVFLKLPTIIVTLGTMTMYQGLSLVVSNATTISNFPTNNWFFNVLGAKILGIYSSVVVMVIVAIIGYILYSHTSFGRHVCAIGANLQAAKYAGIKVDKNRIIVMTLMGVISAISGMTTFAFLAAADPSIGNGSNMTVIAAAIIGGASLAGGAGSILGALIGSFIISVIRDGLVLLSVSIYWQGVVTGAVIIAAVALDYIIKRRRV